MRDPRVVRAVAFTALAAFASLHWAGLVRPAAAGPLLLAVALAVTLGLAHTRRLGPAVRVASSVGALAVALALAGVPLRLLLPDEWDTLAAGVVSGLEALPGTRVPYGGPDDWVRSVIVAGGALLVLVGGLLALRLGRPAAGMLALGLVYVVPVVERDPSAPFLDGAVFAVLTAALLWGDRVRREDLATAGVLLAATTATGMLVAPRVDASRPWIDVEQLAEDLEAQRTSTFRWDHSYRTLDWTREGREVLRVRSRRPAYWKAVALEEFDGVRWRQARAADPTDQDTEVLRDLWRSDLRFEIRALRSRQVVGAGTTLGIRGARPVVTEATPGTFEAVRSPLRRGDQYVASTYVARPTAQRMRDAGTDYPSFVRRQLAVGVPGRTPGAAATTVVLPAWGDDAPAFTLRPGLPSTDGVEVVRASAYRRMYDLARRQRAASATPYDFARRVSASLQRDATYTERPGPSALPLDTFVFDRREGYCQQFSGAMALLLRLGGVPARVASGFSPGGFDEDTGTWIVRDLDAHSWVEVYFPRIGWVAFDPTPAAAPAGGREDEERAEAGAQGDVLGDDPLGREEAEAEPSGAVGVDDRSRATWPLVAGGAVLVVGLLGAAALRRRRRRPGRDGLEPELAAVLRALEGTGREARGGVTLHAVERALGPGPAADYVRSLRVRRYGLPAGEASPLGRAALRRDLAEGLDLGARLRAWAALRPGRAELAARLRRGR